MTARDRAHLASEFGIEPKPAKGKNLGARCGSTPCSYPGCQDEASHQCECGNTFCSDHGTVGGDHEGGTNADGSPYGCYAVPNACWLCGGFDADA